MNPFFQSETTYLENPSILVFADNSASTTIDKGSYNGLETYRELLNQLNVENSKDIDFQLFSAGQQLISTTIDSLTFDDSQTNLFDPVSEISNRSSDIDGSILLTDGIFNQGRNPAFLSENISTPVIVVGLGDTTQQQDLLVRNVSTNSEGYINTTHPVEVTIENNGFEGQSIPVQLRRGDQVIASQIFVPESEVSTTSISFELNLDEEGLQQYNIHIPPFEEEWTTANNTQTFSVDVIDDKQTILSLAFEAHPDVRFIRNLLLTNENTEMIKRTWLGGNRFVEGAFNISADSLDLVVLHGLPSTGLPSQITRQLNSFFSDLPFVITSTPLADFSSLSDDYDFSSPVNYSSDINYQSVGLQPVDQASDHPIMEIPQIDYQNLPQLSAPDSRISVASGASMLFESTYEGEPTNRPVISVQELGNFRSTLISAHGWYKIGQSSNAQYREMVEGLFLNIFNWTATDPDNRNLIIEPAQTTFAGNEQIILNANLLNERGESEPEGTIEIELEGESIDNRFYSMENMGNGQYQLNLDPLPEGLYRYNATASKENRTIDEQQGEFSVRSSNIEFVNTTRNDALLRQIAHNTVGSYMTFENASSIRDTLQKKGMLSKKERVNNTSFFPYQHSFWFILVIALLSAEWIIRKYLALP